MSPLSEGYLFSDTQLPWSLGGGLCSIRLAITYVFSSIQPMRKVWEPPTFIPWSPHRQCQRIPLRFVTRRWMLRVLEGEFGFTHQMPLVWSVASLVYTT